MKQKVVFYNPKAPYYTLPLQFLALSSVVDRDRFDVVIIDARIERKPHELLRSHLRDALCLGISVITGIPIKDAVEVSRMAKRNFPNVKIIWGGWHPSILPEQCLREGYADVAVVGQGELTFLEILDRLAEGKSLEGVNGCVFKEGNEIHVNAIRKFVDINNFPPYDYDLVPLEKYFRFKGIRQIDFYSSQGCPYRCAFCADPYVYNRRWSGLKGSRMLLDVFDVLKRYRV
ncbi:MAG: cobalamin-dependent protein, partial [Bacteroidota bacterium]